MLQAFSEIDKLKQHVLKHNASPFTVKSENNNNSLMEDSEDIVRSPGKLIFIFQLEMRSISSNFAFYSFTASSDGNGCRRFGSFASLSWIRCGYGRSSAVGHDDLSEYFVHNSRHAAVVYLAVR